MILSVASHPKPGIVHNESAHLYVLHVETPGPWQGLLLTPTSLTFNRNETVMFRNTQPERALISRKNPLRMLMPLPHHPPRPLVPLYCKGLSVSATARLKFAQRLDVASCPGTEVDGPFWETPGLTSGFSLELTDMPFVERGRMAGSWHTYSDMWLWPAGEPAILCVVPWKRAAVG